MSDERDRTEPAVVITRSRYEELLRPSRVADRILARLAAHADEAFEHHEKLKAAGGGGLAQIVALAYAEGWRHGTATAHTLATVEALKADTEPEPLTLAQHLERDHDRHAACAACGTVHPGRCLESEG